MPELKLTQAEVMLKDEEIGQDGMISVTNNEMQADGFDPILEAIRKEILEKQREQLRLYLGAQYLELQEQTKSDQDFKLFLANLTMQQKQLVDAALSNEKVKQELEKVEINGYRHIHANFSADKYPGGFTAMTWNGEKADANSRSQVIHNNAIPPEEICTLREKTTNANNLTVTKQDGSTVSIKSYRNIDFPITLDKASGSMHLSIVALNANGGKPPLSKAVYFTAHYKEGSNGMPILVEVSLPQPIKFMGEGKDAIACVEHAGEIYTLAVSRGKYEEMMQEVAKNKGESVNLSQVLEQSPQDMSVVEENNINQNTTKLPPKVNSASNVIPSNQPKEEKKQKAASISGILKSGGKVAVEEITEVIKSGGVENYAKNKLIKMADKIREKLCGSPVNISNNNIPMQASTVGLGAHHKSAKENNRSIN